MNNGAVERIKKFIQLLADTTKWKFKEENWVWDNFDLFRFTKSDFQGASLRINGMNYKEYLLMKVNEDIKKKEEIKKTNKTYFICCSNSKTILKWIHNISTPQ